MTILLSSRAGKQPGVVKLTSTYLYIWVYVCEHVCVYVCNGLSLVIEAGLGFLGDFRTCDKPLVREVLDKGVSDD